MRLSLRPLLAGEPFVAADCFSALTARIVQHVGFEAAYMGGMATGAMHFAIPDYGCFTTTEMIDLAARVAESIDIPLIVDADQAGESVVDVHRSIPRYERAGVAGIHLEDEIPPKHGPWDGLLMSIDEMSARLTAACEARTDPDFVIIARCDELYSEGGGGTGSLDEIIRRGEAYAEAGADLFLPTFATPEQLDAMRAEVPIPLVGFGKVVPGLQVILGGGSTRIAATAVFHAMTYYREHGEMPREVSLEGLDVSELVDQSAYDQVVRNWAGRTNRPLRDSAG